MSFNSVISLYFVWVNCSLDKVMFEVTHSFIVEVNLLTLISAVGVLCELAVSVCCGVSRLWSLNY